MKRNLSTFMLFLSILCMFAQTPQGTWKLKQSAGAMGVGPNLGDTSWWANSAADVSVRACQFDDQFVFNSDGSFQNVMGTETWVETWQDGIGDGCRAGIAPHNGSNPATWSYNSTANTLTLNGLGAFVGLAKVKNGGEISNPSQAVSTITYTVSAISTSEMTLDISIGGGYWRFILQKQGVPTCSDGIQNGDETGVDCGGSCPACVATPMVPAPTPPDRPTADVVSIFSNAYTNIAVNEWGPNWGPASARINDFPISGNATKVMDVTAGQVFAGIDFAPSLFDATSFTHFHIDYWIADPLPVGQVMSLKLSNHSGGMGETSAIEYVPSSLLTNQWVSLDIPLSSFVAASAPANLARNAIAQIVISAARADNNIPLKIYMDNIYFHKNTLGVIDIQGEDFKVSILPNPVNDVLNINSDKEIKNITVYNSTGQIVNIKKIQSSKYNVTSLEKGVYLLNIEFANGQTKALKFIK